MKHAEKIGIFDSGLGGLIIARAIVKAMPEYDYVYLGDTKRVPYGNRSEDAVFEFTKEAVDYLFNKENCGIIIIACNTVSARALHELQKEYTPSLILPLTKGERAKPEVVRKILGVLIPAAEEAVKFGRVGVLGTLGTVSSNTFPKEINKLNRKTRIFQNTAPMLVPLAEAGENVLAKPFIYKYLKPLLQKKIDALVLGCTHYPIFKQEIKKLLPKNVTIISQDKIIPKKLKNYFVRHPEISKKLSKNKKIKILVTDRTKITDELTSKWFGKIKPQLINL